jgi:hypothetical protein
MCLQGGTSFSPSHVTDVKYLFVMSSKIVHIRRFAIYADQVCGISLLICTSLWQAHAKTKRVARSICTHGLRIEVQDRIAIPHTNCVAAVCTKYSTLIRQQHLQWCRCVQLSRHLLRASHGVHPVLSVSPATTKFQPSLLLLQRLQHSQRVEVPSQERL